MANENEITVSLRLLLDQLKKDVADAKATIAAGLGGNTPIDKMAGQSDKASTSMGALESKVKKTTSAIKAQQEALEAWRKSLPAPVVRGIGFDVPKTPPPQGTRSIPYTGQSGLATPPPVKIIAPLPITPPKAPPLAKSVVPPAPPVIHMAGRSQFGKVPSLSVLSTSGIPYISTIARAVLSPMGVAATGVAVALGVLVKAIHSTMAEFERARARYAAQLQSGVLPGNFVQQRHQLAMIIGVGEHEVLAFGKAVAYLNEKVKFSSRIYSETNRNLTATAWEFKVLQQNIGALFATLANDAAPALREFASAMSQVVKIAVAAYNGPLGSFAKFTVKNAIGMVAPIESALVKLLSKLGVTSGQAPAPGMMFQRDPTVSMMERLGLVIGGGVAPDYARRTEANTRKTAEGVSRLVNWRASSGMAERAFNLP